MSQDSESRSKEAIWTPTRRTFGPLDPDRRLRRVEAVRVRRDAEARQRDAVRGVRAGRGRGREGEEDGGGFVGARGVFFHGGEDGGGAPVWGGEGVVEGLEAPG